MILINEKGNELVVSGRLRADTRGRLAVSASVLTADGKWEELQLRPLDSNLEAWLRTVKPKLPGETVEQARERAKMSQIKWKPVRSLTGMTIEDVLAKAEVTGKDKKGDFNKSYLLRSSAQDEEFVFDMRNGSLKVRARAKPLTVDLGEWEAAKEAAHKRYLERKAGNGVPIPQ